MLWDQTGVGSVDLDWPPLRLTIGLHAHLDALGDLFDRQLDWGDPGNGVCMWTPEEAARFPEWDALAEDWLRAELGARFLLHGPSMQSDA